MQRREMNHRSPMRVFEQSMNGGLGRGKIGAVAAGPGVGKTALLVQIALDDLLRDRRVLHIAREQTVEHVRAYYSELFHELSQASALADADSVWLELERHRLIFSLVSAVEKPSPGTRGSSFSRIAEVVGFARTVAHFDPDVIVVDAVELGDGAHERLAALAALAREAHAELWFSVCTTTVPDHSGELPEPLAGYAPLVDVVVFLSPEPAAVRIHLLKDHDHRNLGELHHRLDPYTMRILGEELPPVREHWPDPLRYRLVSGGSHGAEAFFGLCAERWGVAETNYTFEGHRSLVRARGVVRLGEDELGRGDFSLRYVSRRLRRELSEVPLVRRVLQTIWHQVMHASQVFAVGSIQADGTVRGGTGWGAELARIWHKPLFVYDQDQRSWFNWTGAAWEPELEPVILSEVFAGLGTQHLREDGCAAIEALFRRTFGEPAVREGAAR